MVKLQHLLKSALLLALVLCLVLSVGCKKQTAKSTSSGEEIASEEPLGLESEEVSEAESIAGTDGESKAAAASKSAASTAPQKKAIDSYQPQDMKGYVFTVYDATRHGDYELPARGTSYYDDAVLDNIEKVQRDFNCTIKYEFFDPINCFDQIFPKIMAGQKAGDMLVVPTYSLTSFAQAEALVDWKTIKTINLDSPYWRKEIIEAYTANGSIYGVGSDMHYLGAKVAGMMYNRDLVKQLGFEDPYDLAKKDKWTFDVFRAMCKAAVKDLDGDARMTQNDRYGLGGPFFNKALFCSSGSKILAKDAKGKLKFVMDSDKYAMSTVQWLRNLRYTDNIFYNIPIEQWPTWYQMFVNGQILFIGCAANDASSGRDAEFNKGWIVNPKGPGATKWESAIETNANVIGMTVTNPDKEKSAVIIKALNALSKKNIDAWDKEIYDMYFDGDAKSIEMHKLCMNNISFDATYMVRSSWFLFDVTVMKEKDPQQELEAWKPGIVDDLERKFNKW